MGIEKLRTTIDTQLNHLQESDEKKLDQMQETVDNKLQTMPEKRLRPSFARFTALQKKFGIVLSTGKRQLNAASNTIEQTGARTRAMERKLRTVQELPSEKSTEILELPDSKIDEGC